MNRVLVSLSFGEGRKGGANADSVIANEILKSIE